jgi:rhodanese-related sulfurtransferase
MLMRSFAALLVLLALGGCAKPPYSNVDNAQLQALLAQGVPIYDVRRADEWRQTGIVEGSRMLTWVDKNVHPNPEFMPRFTARVDKNAPVILICRTGNRTDKLARELMEKHGYTQVYNVRNGITGWIGEGNPVVKQL